MDLKAGICFITYLKYIFTVLLTKLHQHYFLSSDLLLAALSEMNRYRIKAAILK